ncbi:nuclease-related domain-containing protein [Caldisericum exile]|uniref:nuclease-related domain-containing protein n=1 Tax=Caldisericum exile TaxID=693075 RepID=UPI003C759E32
MFAKVIQQDEKIKEKFYEKIKLKIARERQQVQENDDSGFFARLFGNTAVDKFDRKQYHNESIGSSGENELKNQMWLLLKSDSFVLPDYVFEVAKDEFIQLDSIVVNLRGIFLIEVKTWSGSFLASDKEWKMKQGREWERVSNPTAQHKRHFNLFKLWLENNAKEIYEQVKDIIYPVIVLKQVDWIKADYSSIPVVSGAMGFINFILDKPRAQLSQELVESIVEKLSTAKPYEEKSQIKFEEGMTKQGKKYVKVEGTRNEALQIAEEYAKTYKVSNVYQDKSNNKIFFFYLENK